MNREIKYIITATCAQLKQATSQVGSFFKNIQGLYVANKALSFGRKFLDYVSEIKAASDATGVGTENLQALSIAARKAGVDTGSFQMMLLRLRQAQGEIGRDKGLADTFKRLGLTVNDVRTLSPEDLLQRIADSMAKAGWRADVTAAGFSVLGRGSGKLLEALKQLHSQGLAGLRGEYKTQILSDEDLKKAVELKNTLTDIRGMINALGGKIILPLVGYHEAWARTAGELSTGTGINESLYQSSKATGGKNSWFGSDEVKLEERARKLAAAAGISPEDMAFHGTGVMDRFGLNQRNKIMQPFYEAARKQTAAEQPAAKADISQETPPEDTREEEAKLAEARDKFDGERMTRLEYIAKLEGRISDEKTKAATIGSTQADRITATTNIVLLETEILKLKNDQAETDRKSAEERLDAMLRQSEEDQKARDAVKTAIEETRYENLTPEQKLKQQKEKNAGAADIYRSMQAGTFQFAYDDEYKLQVVKDYGDSLREIKALEEEIAQAAQKGDDQKKKAAADRMEAEKRLADLKRPRAENLSIEQEFAWRNFGKGKDPMSMATATSGPLNALGSISSTRALGGTSRRMVRRLEENRAQFGARVEADFKQRIADGKSPDEQAVVLLGEIRDLQITVAQNTGVVPVAQ